MKNTKGFTLIELLVVVLIIGILAAMALPQYFKAVEKSKSAEAIQVLGTLAQAEQRFYLIHDAYTADYGQFDIDFVGANGVVATAGSTLATNNFRIDLDGITGKTIEQGFVTATRVKGGGTGDGLYKLTKCLGNGKLCCEVIDDTSRINCAGLGFAATDSSAEGCCGGTPAGE